MFGSSHFGLVIKIAVASSTLYASGRFTVSEVWPLESGVTMQAGQHVHRDAKISRWAIWTRTGSRDRSEEDVRSARVLVFMGECSTTIVLAKECSFPGTESKGLQDDSAEGESDYFSWRRTV